jgi:superoxide reductase
LTEELFSSINKAADVNNLTDLEKKHLPIIEAPDSVKAGEQFDVKIEVGKILKHPNEAAHHIQWIVLLNGSVTLAIIQLTPETTSPNVSLKLTIEKDAKLRALERCNIHGEWEFSKEVKAT